MWNFCSTILFANPTKSILFWPSLMASLLLLFFYIWGTYIFSLSLSFSLTFFIRLLTALNLAFFCISFQPLKTLPCFLNEFWRYVSSNFSIDSSHLSMIASFYFFISSSSFIFFKKVILSIGWSERLPLAIGASTSITVGCWTVEFISEFSIIILASWSPMHYPAVVGSYLAALFR